MRKTFSPIQRRMLTILEDGLPHAASELKDCLYDEQGDISNIRAHLSLLRKKIRPKRDIICEIRKRRTFYRLEILLATAAR